MHLTFRGVNDAFYGIVKGIHTKEIPTVTTSSRNGDVLQVVDPVIITYTHPRERVLLDPNRDCNPFFHLYEALWMLAGRNDVAPLSYYNGQISKYSDDGMIFNGAYGYRWRQSLTTTEAETLQEVDQLNVIVDHLCHLPDSRRAVLQMWNVQDDLLKIGGDVCPVCRGTRRGPKRSGSFKAVDASYACPGCAGTGLSAGSRDVCCNICTMFAVRREVVRERSDPDNAALGSYCVDYLDMTVINRSNDAIWGMLGANVVHFSFLQEYLAARLGVGVGKYHQISNNLHAYLSNWKPESWLEHGETWLNCSNHPYPTLGASLGSRGTLGLDDEVKELVSAFSSGSKPINHYKLHDPFLETVAKPMLMAWRIRKELKQDGPALELLKQVQAEDWQVAARTWIERRRKSS